jgi:hypothetical protein
MLRLHALPTRLPFMLLLIVPFVAGCSNKTTNPTPMLSTETLTGAVDVQGQDFKTFKVNYTQLLTDASLTVTSLKTVANDTPLPATTTIGAGFGSLDFGGTNCVRSSLYSTDTAQQNKELIAPGVFQAGTYCVQIYDVGTLTEKVNYTIVVKHY